jgi:signal transduction histidine kinase
MKIAYLQDNKTMARKYASQLLAEPNLAPHHKGRTLYRLSIMAFDDNDAEEFNRVYDEMKRLEQTDGIRMENVLTEVNHLIVNGDYKSALRLADRLSADTCAELKALVYHRLGDDARAYEYMVRHKQIADSLARIAHNTEVASMYLRMNNDRLRLEQELLEQQNGKLRYQFYIALGVAIIVILLFIINRRRKIIHMLKNDNMLLDYDKRGAEAALKNLNDLSFYESKNDLPLTMPVRVNMLCDHLANLAQNNCHKGVITVFKTDFDDEFEIISNPNALEKLLTLLLSDATRYTQKGFINLQCADAGELVRFSVTDTGTSHDPGTRSENVLDDDGVSYVNMNFNVCQSICRLLHGHIWYDQEYADGTRFYFELPKRPSIIYREAN